MNSTATAAATSSRPLETVACPKCDGKGYIRAFGHYAGGVCFDCGGAGTFEITAATPADIANAARARAAHEVRCRFMTAYPDLRMVVDCQVEAGLLRGAREHFQRIGHPFAGRNTALLAIYERCEPIVAAVLARKAAHVAEIEALRLAVLDLRELDNDWNQAIRAYCRAGHRQSYQPCLFYIATAQTWPYGEDMKNAATTYTPSAPAGKDLPMTTPPREFTFQFVSRSAAWAFMRACDEAGDKAGFPNEGPDEYAVRVITGEPGALAVLAAIIRSRN